MTQILNILDNL